MKKRLYMFAIALFGLAGVFHYAACTPAPGVRINGKATGGGTLAKTGGGRATFGFNGDSCSGTTKGRLNYLDKNTALFPNGGVMLNGTLTSIVQCEDANGCFDASLGTCPVGGYIVTFDYTSNNKNYPGTGQGGVCLVDGGEGQAAAADEAAVGLDGVYDGYGVSGTVNGNVQGFACSD